MSVVMCVNYIHLVVKKKYESHIQSPVRAKLKFGNENRNMASKIQMKRGISAGGEVMSY